MLKIYNALINTGHASSEWIDVVIAADHEQAMKEKDAKIACLEKRVARYKEDADGRSEQIASLRKSIEKYAIRCDREKIIYRSDCRAEGRD